MTQRVTFVLLAVVLATFAVGSAGSAVAGPGEAEQAAIRREVEQAMQRYIASINRADLPAVLASFAEVPEFRFADAQGRLYDLAGARQAFTDAFATYQSAVHDTPQTSVLVLASDSVHYVWNGSGSYVLKDNTVMRAPACTYSCVFRRFNGVWKILSSRKR